MQRGDTSNSNSISISRSSRIDGLTTAITHLALVDGVAHTTGHHHEQPHDTGISPLESLPLPLLEEIAILVLWGRERATTMALARASPRIYLPAVRTLMAHATSPVYLIPSSQHADRNGRDQFCVLTRKSRLGPEPAPAPQAVGALGFLAERSAVMDIALAREEMRETDSERLDLDEIDSLSRTRRWLLISRATAHESGHTIVARQDLLHVPERLIRRVHYSLGPFAPIPPHATNFSLVNLHNGRFAVELAGLFAPQLPPSLRELTLHNVHLTARTMATLVAYLPRHLVILNLSGTSMRGETEDDAPALILAENLPPRLRELFLIGTELRDHGLTALCAQLPRTLTVLALTGNYFDSAPSLAALIEHMPPALEMLLLDGALSLPDSAALLFPALPRSLLHLSLAKNDLGDDGVAMLAKHMPPALSTLMLHQTNISNHGVATLVPALPASLTYLDLGENMRVGDASIEALIAAWPPRLAFVDMDTCGMVTMFGMAMLDERVMRARSRRTGAVDLDAMDVDS
ncbi:hypothetical protein AMAG_08453 [Allomyces macrogynus ATCC 38327]|uniref:Uncharacterized protein n=1 Tax=Allomyces macrogynus (strain ATCC 38327) TaxID=578462 RepID=A0A0L0SLP5_ALLM3|nr:hypothetical protein AMAG_08453 [Allomyces macrogynus ATCC 38327]|eukprot:KNE63314.1 hypothetical protein AMAG_08453 [Allomyces macrogynus ATCC 38327]